MAATQVFSGVTADTESAGYSFDGEYTFFSRGDFDSTTGARIVGLISPQGAEDYAYHADLQFFRNMQVTMKIIGSIKFRIVNAGTGSTIDFWFDGPIT